jgi:hypothetical protein
VSYLFRNLVITYVELCTSRRAGSVQGDHLRTEEVLAVRNALGDRNTLQAKVSNNLARSPGAAVVSVLLDLEPVMYVRPVASDNNSFGLTSRCRCQNPSERYRPSSDTQW